MKNIFLLLRLKICMVYTIGMTFSRTNHPNHHFTKKRANKQNRYSKCAERKKTWQFLCVRKSSIYKNGERLICMSIDLIALSF